MNNAELDAFMKLVRVNEDLKRENFELRMEIHRLNNDRVNCEENTVYKEE